MMERRKVDVTAHAGYRSGEKPRSFVVEGKRISVAEIISQRVEEAAFIHRAGRGVVFRIIPD
jgi:hypothetical protein